MECVPEVFVGGYQDIALGEINAILKAHPENSTAKMMGDFISFKETDPWKILNF